MSLLYLLTFLVAITQVLDWYTTTKILAAGGVELNPVAKWLMAQTSVNGYLIGKGILITLLAYIAGLQLLVAPFLILAVYIGVILYNRKSL